MGIGAAAVGGLLGITSGAISRHEGRKAEERNFERNRRLMNIQQHNQMELNKQGTELSKQLSMELFEKQGYGAQME